MVKGRRTRQAATVGQVLAAATATTMDDTASPKRKDFKFDNNSITQTFTNNNNNNHIQHLTNGSKPPTAEAMVLRGGRAKLNGIDRYFTSQGKPASPEPVDQHVIDLTDDNTSESIAESPLMALGFATVTKSNPASNIFLQEPVLSLNIDKSSPSVGQSSRVIIKNSFFGTEMQTQFSPPKCDPMWGGGVVKREPLDFALDLSKPTQVTEIDSTTFHDSSSCDSGDSGVVILPAATTTTTNTIIANGGGHLQFEPLTPGEGRRRKPATPHRIVCPSPVKSAPIVASPPTALSHLNIQSKRQPRKNVKSKRRLHTKELENALEEAVTSVPNSSVPEASPMLETGVASVGAVTGMLPPSAAVATDTTTKPETLQKQRLKKPVLNMAANPTALQNTNNNQSRANGAAAVGANKKVTDYFQVRRSVRKTKKEVQWERDRDLERAIHEQRESGLKVVNFEGKGRGVVTTRKFARGEFVVEYIGDLIDMAEAKLREQEYAEDDNTGCYMYYFKYQNVQYCIDATAESGKLGRLLNHSRNGNLMTKTVLVNDVPHLVLLAKEDIPEGVELTYDYGDRSKEALQHHPWLAF
uniref:[histone H4]-lysine(20) N-methyltransferase n=1 Tax=Culex tarsalis TaxID=7177 RepID=A0A1Q3EVZ3_CULTA